jgi:hypothetical protein
VPFRSWSTVATLGEPPKRGHWAVTLFVLVTGQLLDGGSSAAAGAQSIAHVSTDATAYADGLAIPCMA